MEQNYIGEYLEDNGYTKDSYEQYASAEEIAKAMESMRDYVFKVFADTLFSTEIDVHHVDENCNVKFLKMSRSEYLNYVKEKLDMK